LYKDAGIRKAGIYPGILAFACLFIALSFPTASAAENAEPAQATNSNVLLIGAAASLRAVWPDLTDALPPNIPASSLKVSFASTGLLQVQIENGAPFDLFLAADSQSPKKLKNLNLTKEPSVSFASGRLVLVTRHPSISTLPDALADLNARQTSKKPPSIAIANSRHAPYGLAAKQWLAQQSLWPWPTAELLLGENTAQTLQFLLSGAVDYALLPDALSQNIGSGYRVIPLPDHEYDLIEHHVAILRDAPPSAHEFVNWLLSSDVQNLLAISGLPLGVG